MIFINNGCRWVAQIKYSLSFFVLFCSGCVSAQLNETQRWQSQLYAEHELVGKIWDSSLERFVAQDDLYDRVEQSSYLLLGEKHDNPDHHALQLQILDRALRSENVASVSFEMMSSEQQPLLQDLSAQQLTSLESINEYLEWDNDGWNWDYYGPLVRRAIQAGVEINAANISNDEMMQVYGADTPAEIAAVLDEETVAALERDIDESHCGLLPESQFPAMVRVQQARDFAMAESLGAASSKQRILIAGNYHIRRDLGAPNYILHAQSNLDPQQIVSLAFLEVDESSAEPADYLQQFGSVKAYDYIWFTPAISNEDYCASMRAQ